MRIAVWHNLPSGGGKRALYHHVKGLVQRGHSLECWTLTTADQSYLPLKDLLDEHIIPFDNEREKNPLRRIMRKTSSYYDELARMRAFDEACRRCAREIDAGRFDVLFANSSRLYLMPYIMRHVRMPKVLYLQEPYRHLYEANPILPWVDGLREDMTRLDPFRPRGFIYENLNLRALRLQAKMEWLNAQACDLLLVNSYYSRESILRAYGREAKVCYLGVDTNLFRDLHREREHFIVSLGSFAKTKGVDLTIRSISLLPVPRPRLVWIANWVDESYLKEMLELAGALGVDLNLKSMVSDEELVDILNRAALLLYTPRLEPFGLAPLEANACATPVVAVAEGGVRETIKDGINGFLVDREPEGIAEALHRLLSDQVLARQMGERAAACVRKQWTVELSIDRLEQHLLKVVSIHRE
ncbi:MAG TPA: glycosyltransferase family 4 protein [Pyrinomonadaceae bacterium]|jgi:glycosyltransferase involved in cell wall biosynthesis